MRQRNKRIVSVRPFSSPFDILDEWIVRKKRTSADPLNV